MDREIRQTEHKSLPEDRDTKKREDDVRDLSRTPLKKYDDGIQRSRRERDHKEEKEQTERKCPARPDAVTEQKDPPAGHDQRKDRYRQLIGGQIGCFCPPIPQRPQPDQDRTKPRAPFPRGEKGASVQVERIQAEPRDQYDMGIVFLLSGQGIERTKWCPKPCDGGE